MFYPVGINIEDKLVCVVGGGKVAYRKACTLLRYGARVRIVSPEFSDRFNDAFGDVSFIVDTYKKKHIKDVFLVIAATSDMVINSRIARDAKDIGILCNVIDDVNISDFIVPSSVKRGDLIISVSTSGKSPALSKKIREEIEKSYGEEYIEKVRLLGEIRDLVLKECRDEAKREEIFRRIIDFSLEELAEFIRKYKNKF